MSNETFNDAYNNIDNRKIINKVLGKYTKTIPYEELKQIGEIALWKTLRYHEDNKGKKFTSSLWQFLEWECNKECNYKKRFKKLSVEPLIDNLSGYIEDNNIHILKQLINLLTPEQQILIREYYFNRLTMQEIGDKYHYSKELASVKIKKVIKILQGYFGVL